MTAENNSTGASVIHHNESVMNLSPIPPRLRYPPKPQPSINSNKPPTFPPLRPHLPLSVQPAPTPIEVESTTTPRILGNGVAHLDSNSDDENQPFTPHLDTKSSNDVDSHSQPEFINLKTIIQVLNLFNTDDLSTVLNILSNTDAPTEFKSLFSTIKAQFDLSKSP